MEEREVERARTRRQVGAEEGGAGRRESGDEAADHAARPGSAVPRRSYDRAGLARTDRKPHNRSPERGGLEGLRMREEVSGSGPVHGTRRFAEDERTLAEIRAVWQRH